MEWMKLSEKKPAPYASVVPWDKTMETGWHGFLGGRGELFAYDIEGVAVDAPKGATLWAYLDCPETPENGASES